MDLLIEILNFINDNYLKFAIGLILILMAIIGYYAEKTNFGNKLKIDKENGQSKDDEVNLNNVRINDFLDKEQTINQNNDIIGKQPEIQNENILTANNNNIENENKENNVNEVIKQNEPLVQPTNNDIENIDDEFDKILSRDDSSINKDLIMDINNMKVDPLEKDDSTTSDALVKLNSNIDLPKIDDLKSDNDIWKF